MAVFLLLVIIFYHRPVGLSAMGFFVGCSLVYNGCDAGENACTGVNSAMGPAK